MRIEVGFKNPRTGEIKLVKVGWSWTLFFFSNVFGIPLFMRKLHSWGAILLAVSLASFILPVLLPNRPSSAFLLLLLPLFGLVMDIWFGIKGNEMTAKNYLNLGWTFLEPDSDATRFGKLKWGLTQ